MNVANFIPTKSLAGFASDTQERTILQPDLQILRNAEMVLNGACAINGSSI